MNVTQKWIDAAKVLAVDPAVPVLCPVCGQANLAINDLRSVDVPSVIERVMECPNCGSLNTIRLVRPEQAI
jgi:predicted RNA-binding Zn-ribbon protein involved in translation (DUF1610 family)